MPRNTHTHTHLNKIIAFVHLQSKESPSPADLCSFFLSKSDKYVSTFCSHFTNAFFFLLLLKLSHFHDYGWQRASVFTEYNTCEFIYNIFFFGTALDFDTFNTGMYFRKQHTLFISLYTRALQCTDLMIQCISMHTCIVNVSSGISLSEAFAIGLFMTISWNEKYNRNHMTKQKRNRQICLMKLDSLKSHTRAQVPHSRLWNTAIQTCTMCAMCIVRCANCVYITLSLYIFSRRSWASFAIQRKLKMKIDLCIEYKTAH